MGFLDGYCDGLIDQMNCTGREGFLCPVQSGDTVYLNTRQVCSFIKLPMLLYKNIFHHESHPFLPVGCGCHGRATRRVSVRMEGTSGVTSSTLTAGSTSTSYVTVWRTAREVPMRPWGRVWRHPSRRASAGT